MASESSVIVEFDLERDKKEFISAYQQGDACNRKIADFAVRLSKTMTNQQIGDLVGRREWWVRKYKSWAAGGYIGHPFADPAKNHKNRGGPTKSTLETNENFEDDAFEPDENVEEPGKVLANVLDSIKQSRAVAEAYRKILKVSPFDRRAKKEISDAIDSLIRKWKTVQSTLAAKGKADGEQVS